MKGASLPIAAAGVSQAHQNRKRGEFMNIMMMGIDLAKNIFCGARADETGKAPTKPKFMRQKLPALIAEFGVVGGPLRRGAGVSKWPAYPRHLPPLLRSQTRLLPP
jgi:hypothetical protein